MRARDRVVSYNVNIRDLIRQGNIDEARNMFDGMPDRNTVSWNTMIRGYLLRGREKRAATALKLFLVMPDTLKDAFTWAITAGGLARAGQSRDSLRLLKRSPGGLHHPEAWAAVVSGAQKNGSPYEALVIFRQMLSAGITTPVPHSLTSATAAAADLSSLSAGRQLFSQIQRRGLSASNQVGNSVVSMFFECGSLDEAIAHFERMPTRDLVTWNAVITGLACHGRGEEAVSVFHEMQAAGFEPDRISCVGVLAGCSHCGYVEQGRRIFESMEGDYGVERRTEHYACYVDLYARAGMFGEATELAYSSPFGAEVWRVLLNACRGTAVCNGDENTRGRRRRRANIGKEVGFSWVQVEEQTHLFTARDETHCESSKIYLLLRLLTDDAKGVYHQSSHITHQHPTFI